MSLVDYASSSDDEDAPQITEKPNQQLQQPQQPQQQKQQQETVKPSQPQKLGSTSKQHSHGSVQSSEPAIEKLPDVSLLLNSPQISPHLSNSCDHSVRVAAAMAENSSRKRDAKALPPASLRSKVPRGSLTHTRNVPDTENGMLVPPQLRGRSNVVTEDIGKLFVQKRAEPPSH